MNKRSLVSCLAIISISMSLASAKDLRGTKTMAHRGGGGHSVSDDDSTPAGLAKNITNLPNLEFIGTEGQTTTVKGTLLATLIGSANYGGKKVLESSTLDVDNASSVQLSSQSGHTTLSRIIDAKEGQKLTLVFVNTVVVETNDNGISSNNINLASGNTTFDNNDVLELFYTGNVWLEISRSNNN